MLIALDQQAQRNVDFSLDYDPIITSVSVTPNIGTYDAATVFSFTAIDPASGASIADYSLTHAGDFQTPQFQATATNAGDTTPDFARCQDPQAGNSMLGSCSIQYQPALPDAGNFPWTMTVTDNTGKTDAVDGYFAVDATGTLELTINNWHVPKIDSVTPTDSDGTSTSTVQFGKAGIMTVSISDPDIANGLNDVPALTLLEVVTLDDTISEGSQANVACPAVGDVAISAGSIAGDTITYTATWSPWTAATANGDVAADYGETWCAFKFESSDDAKDSAGTASPLYSNEVEYTMAAIGTPTTGGEATSQIPHFVLLFISDTAPVELDVVTVSVTFQDGDSDSTLAVTHAGVLQDVAWSEEESASNAETNIDSQSGAVTRTLLMTIAADAAAQADQSVTVTLTDEADANLVDTRVITFATVAGVSRNRRQARSGAPTSMSAVTLSGGNHVFRQRRTITGRQQIPTSSMQIHLDGTKMKITTSAIQGKQSGSIAGAESNDGVAAAGNGAASKFAPNVFGALVGCAILAVVLVGVVVRTKQNATAATATHAAKRGSVDAGTLEEGGDALGQRATQTEHAQGVVTVV